MLKASAFEKIYDPSIGEKEKWCINDHTFIYGRDGLWHLFGITHPDLLNPGHKDVFAHATSPFLTRIFWKKLPFALTVDWEEWREVHLWAPHVIFYNNLYYMFYCAGDPDATKFKIHLATSKDLKEWTRHPKNPMFIDGFHARDPFILKFNDIFILYYTATEPVKFGNHIVAYRTSKDLINWSSERKICFKDPEMGDWGGPTESPFVLRRGEYFYLFIGPRGGYVGTDVFRSKDPFKWELSDQVGHIDSHALEVIRDVDGSWYVSHCGIGQGGVYLAPLTWLDGLDDSDTSMPAPAPTKK
jgi:beta-fructofuranosidase